MDVSQGGKERRRRRGCRRDVAAAFALVVGSVGVSRVAASTHAVGGASAPTKTGVRSQMRRGTRESFYPVVCGLLVLACVCFMWVCRKLFNKLAAC